MIYQQAFHTSCRTGLGPQPGFQFNAASEGLSEPVLAELAAAHAGYQAPPDATQQPTRDQLASFPTTLKFLPVDGVGPVLSRTTYVGREYRGTDGEPDSGRYGNYFSHILVGSEKGGFADLLPIELWSAPHWTEDEATTARLDSLGEITPGSLTLERALELLSGAGEGTLAAVAGSALVAVGGGARVVVAEPLVERMAAWVAWASFCLPPGLAERLTFSTYTGTPVRENGVMLCVTSPACDLSFQPYELGSSVELILADQTVSGDGTNLYGRIVAELSTSGADAVSDAVMRLPRDVDHGSEGALLAVLTERLDLVRAEEVGPTLSLVCDRIDQLPAERWAELIKNVDPPRTPADAPPWVGLYETARMIDGATGGTALVDEALGRLIPLFDQLSVTPIDGIPLTAPSVRVLARWLEAIKADPPPSQLAASIKTGSSLGLLGLNDALDRAVGEKLADHLADPAFEGVADTAIERGGSAVADATATRAVEMLEQGELGIEQLTRLAGEPRCRVTIEREVEKSDSFPVLFAWEQVVVGENPTRRPAAVQQLVRSARTEEEKASLARFYGKAGPASLEEHTELLEAFVAADAMPAPSQFDAALAELAKSSLVKDRRRALRLTAVLGKEPIRSQSRRSAIYALWWLVENSRGSDFEVWSGRVHKCSQAKDSGLPGKRLDELRELAAERMVGEIASDKAAVAYTSLDSSFGKKWERSFGRRLREQLAAAADPTDLVIDAFVTLHRVRGTERNPVADVLPSVLGALSERELEAAQARLPSRYLRPWSEMLDEHPPKRRFDGSVSRLFRSRDKR